MLSREEKIEMLADALNASRRDSFREVGRKISKITPSIDNYIKFLNDIQTVYGPFKYLKKPQSVHNNKL